MTRKPISRNAKTAYFIIICVLCVMFALFCATAYRTFFFEYIGVKGSSMEPTFASEGDVVKISKNFYDINKHDIVVLFRSDNENKYPVSDSPSAKKNGFIAFCDNFGSIFGKKIPEKVLGYTCVIKRIIGLPGDTIQISKAKLYINGEEQNDTFVNETMHEWNGQVGVKDGIWLIKENEYFVLGDNRNYSIDSEDYGAIASNQIYGKVNKIIKK